MAARTPLGDSSSAPRATGLTDVTAFTRIPVAAVVRALEVPLRAALRRARILAGIEGLLARAPGPAPAARERTRSAGWVRLSDTAGRHVTLVIEVPNTNTFTAASVVQAALQLPACKVSGALAPSTAQGVDFIKTIPGIELTFRTFDRDAR